MYEKSAKVSKIWKSLKNLENFCSEECLNFFSQDFEKFLQDVKNFRKISRKKNAKNIETESANCSLARVF